MGLVERQQSAALGSGSLPVVQIYEPTRSDQSASQDLAIGDLGQDSLIKARYASTVLRVAQTADQHTAARLLSGLAREFPCRNERVEIAELHFRAIDSFFELATALKNETGSRPHDLWKRAVDAVTAWLQAVSICKAFPVGPRLIFPGVATAAQSETADDVSHSTAGGTPTRKQDS
jgi:hypothetical protein